VHLLTFPMAKPSSYRRATSSVGIAVEEGFITSIEDPITQYVPSLGESAHNGVRIKDVLQMSSGVRWTEDYSDPTAEIHDFGEVKATGRSISDYMQEKLCEPLGMEAPGFWLLGYTYQCGCQSETGAIFLPSASTINLLM
jgi:CubicO group peptidase (beta-lactamase class C family)